MGIWFRPMAPRKRKQKSYTLSYLVDQAEKELVMTLVENGKKAEYQVHFTRNGLKETGEKVCEKFCRYRMETGKYKVRLARQELTDEDRNLVHQIFPFVPAFESIDSFYSAYMQKQQFDYDAYEQLKSAGTGWLQDKARAADGKWKCENLDVGRYLSCKWEDEGGNVHILMLNDSVFYSDLDYECLLKQEEASGFTASEEVGDFEEVYPETMLHNYLDNRGEYLFRFLTSRVMNHPMELLGKAGLSRLADRLPLYQGINVTGKNLKEVFGLPLPVLRAANAGEDDMLCALEDRELLQQVYQECPSAFEKPLTLISELWIRYHYLCRPLGIDAESQLQPGKLKDTLRYLNAAVDKGQNPYTVFVLYQNYIAYCEKIGRYERGLYPKNLEGAVAHLVDILQIQYEELKKERYSFAVNRPEYRELEEDSAWYRYKIGIPETQEELIEAGNRLHNCLAQYVKRIKEQRTMVLLIRERETGRLVGALEIKNGRLIQAKGPVNAELTGEVKAYVEGYLVRKGIKKGVYAP